MTEVRTCDFCKKEKTKIWTFEKNICYDCLKKSAGYRGGEQSEEETKEN